MRAGLSEMPNTTPPNLCRVTPRELNELHRQFWVQQSELTDKRISNPILYANATANMQSEALREVPLKHRKTLELALADAEEEWNSGKDSLREFCRKGGKARKGDSLSKLVEALVRANPKITERELSWRLNRQVGKGVIFSIDTKSSVVAGNVRMITFEDEDGRRKTAPVSGLKDRLRRAKAKINSR